MIYGSTTSNISVPSAPYQETNFRSLVVLIVLGMEMSWCFTVSTHILDSCLGLIKTHQSKTSFGIKPQSGKYKQTQWLVVVCDENATLLKSQISWCKIWRSQAGQRVKLLGTTDSVEKSRFKLLLHGPKWLSSEKTTCPFFCLKGSQP